MSYENQNLRAQMNDDIVEDNLYTQNLSENTIDVQEQKFTSQDISGIEENNEEESEIKSTEKREEENIEAIKNSIDEEIVEEIRKILSADDDKPQHLLRKGDKYFDEGTWRDIKNRFDKYEKLIDTIPLLKGRGRVKEATRELIISEGPVCKRGDICYIEVPERGGIEAEVVGFRGRDVYLAPIGSVMGVGNGNIVTTAGQPLGVSCSDSLLGKVLDGSGKVDAEMNSIKFARTSSAKFYNPPIPVMREAFSAIKRKRITEPIQTGVRVIDGILTVGKGQRVAIMSGSGVGKSTLLSMIARNTDADVNIIALIGERRREVLDFIERDLGPEGFQRSVIVCATSDSPPVMRVKGAFVATTIAEYFRDQGKSVLLMVDSLTRLAQAQREIGLSMDEPPTTRGYPPSVFSILPKLLERAGTSDKGSITAFYNVLVEGDDLDEPVTDAVRGILDGHIVLSRRLANRGHYPAVDVNASISRLMLDVVSKRHNDAALYLKRLYASYADMEDLINMNAYQRGSSPEVDEAIAMKPVMDMFLRQGIYDESSFENTKRALLSMFYKESEVNDEMGLREEETQSQNMAFNNEHSVMPQDEEIVL